MIRTISLGIIAVFSGLVGINASAATYYVDFQAGSDSNNGTSTATPWKHCPGDGSATGVAASATPAAGDIIAFKGGVTYVGTISIKSSGTSGSYITYDGNLSGWGNGSRAILSNSQVRMNYKSYIRWQNFEHSGGSNCILGDGHATLSQNYWHIYNCFFHDTINGDGAICAYGDCNNITIESCTFQYCNYVRGADGTHNGGGSATVLTDTTKNWAPNSLVGYVLVNKSGYASGNITANTATTITTSGMATEGGSSVSWASGHKYAVRGRNGRGSIYFNGDRDGPGGIAVGDTVGNKVLRCSTQYNGDTPFFFFGQSNLEIGHNTILGPNAGFHSNGITHYYSYRSNGGDAEIHHNYYSGERVAITFEGVRPTGTGINIYNNIFNSNNNVAYPISSNGPGQTGTVRIINNVLVGGTAQSVGFGSDTWSSVIVRNNILCGPVSLGGSGTLTQSHNCFTNSNSGSGANSLYITNLSAIFTNAALASQEDFQIRSTFAGKDVGYPAGEYGIVNDFAGMPRPQGGGWDIGAIEHSGTATVTVPASPGTLTVAPQ